MIYKMRINLLPEVVSGNFARGGRVWGRFCAYFLDARKQLF